MPAIQIGSLSIQYEHKAIKNLHISVMPPDGHVRVAAPLNMTETTLRMAVIKRIPWIKKQQSDFLKQPRQSPREMVNGESHYLWGMRHRLTVKECQGRHLVEVRPGKLVLYVKPGTTMENKSLVLAEFYRSELKNRVAQLLESWQPKVSVLVADWGVKIMKTKWGSCNIEAKRIWINLELAKKPFECLEYIVLHELLHLLERMHNERFKERLDKLMPDWRERRSLLNSLPVRHEEWVY